MYKEIDDLMNLAKEGDINSKELLLLKLRPLVISSINKYYPNSKDFEDLIQDGNMVILECINEFQPAKGVYFLGYVKTMLKYAYLQKYKIKKTMSLNTPIGDNVEGDLIDLLVSDEREAIENIVLDEMNKTVKESLKVLAPRQKQVIEMFFIKGMTISEIATELNISYRTVVNAKTRALEILKIELTSKGL